jgi:gentisate 1,2-dioxygenase
MRLATTSAPHEAQGYKLRYTNPATGGNVFPTIAAFMQRLPKNFDGRGYRATDGAVYCVVESNGAVYFGDERHEFEPHDTFVIPPWQTHRFATQTDCVLFSFSDRAAQETLGFWREEAFYKIV